MSENKLEDIINIETNIAVGSVDFDFEGLKQNVINVIIPFKSMVITEDSVKRGKEARAYLNRFKTAISDQRIKNKKVYLAPFDFYESKVKELGEIIDSGIKNLDDQVKQYEENQRTAKKVEIQKHFMETSVLRGNWPDISFDRLFDPTWVNATTSTKAWKDALEAKINKIWDDQDLLGLEDLEDMNLMKKLYMDILDYMPARREYQRIKDLSKPTKQLEQVAQAQEAKKTFNLPGLEDIPDKNILFKTVTVSLTKQQYSSFIGYLIDHNIEYTETKC